MSRNAALTEEITVAVSVANWLANCWIAVARSGGWGASKSGSPIVEATAGTIRSTDRVIHRLGRPAI
jgi:hypothetical protein